VAASAATEAERAALENQRLLAAQVELDRQQAEAAAVEVGPKLSCCRFASFLQKRKEKSYFRIFPSSS
jgi:hypothetical protein